MRLQFASYRLPGRGGHAETLSPQRDHVIDFLAELGTRKHCRHNETMFSGPNMVDYCIMSVFVVAIQYSIYTPRPNYCLYLFLITEALAELQYNKFTHAQLCSLVTIHMCTDENE